MGKLRDFADNFKRIDGVWNGRIVHVLLFNWRFWIALPVLLVAFLLVLLTAVFSAIAEGYGWLAHGLMDSTAMERFRGWVMRARAEQFDAASDRYKAKHGPKYSTVIVSDEPLDDEDDQ